ncbi:MAG: glucose-6-phosphate isomerase, partial [Porticoccaceae bacterium]|nr:glucose-6-phosphate isomerase [Porticoccaceae bacterium]
MKSKQYSPNETVAWRNLEALAQDSIKTTIADLFKSETDRAEKMSVEIGGIVLDFSKNLVSQDVLSELMALVDESNLETHRDAMFAGESINSTEDRAVLHAALRAEPEDANTPQEKERNRLVKTQLDHVREVSEKIRSGGWQGSTGKSITDIVNIGIGGSDLGPKLACNGLAEFAHPDINFHFISNVDGAEILTTLAKLNPETTLITVASKTFTTQETLL